MTTENKRTQDQTRLWIFIAGIVLIVTIAIGAALLFGRQETPPKAELDEIIESTDVSDAKSVTEALGRYGLVFNKRQVRDVELVYSYYYYKETPPAGELAYNVATLFIEHYYDDIDLSDKDAVTTALMKCYTASVGDPYSYYYTPEEYEQYLSELEGDTTKVGIGVIVTANYEQVSLRVSTVLPGSAAEAAGVKKGDYVIAVDGSRIEDVGIDGLMDLIAGEIGSTVEVTVLRGEDEIVLTAVRTQISDVSVIYEMMDNKIAYIQVLQFKANTPDKFKVAVDAALDAGAEGIVFDMRGNPGGLLDAVVEMIDYIAPDGVRIASFTMGKSSPTVYTAADGHSVDLPITVLCNGGTASAGELFTAAMRDYGKDGVLDVSIVGETTYKKGVMQTSYEISGGYALKLTVAFYNPPCDVNYDGVGVVPNCPIANEGEADDQLAAAIAEIERMITKNGGGL